MALFADFSIRCSPPKVYEPKLRGLSLLKLKQLHKSALTVCGGGFSSINATNYGIINVKYGVTTSSFANLTQLLVANLQFATDNKQIAIRPLLATDCKSVASAVIYVKFAKLLTTSLVSKSVNQLTDLDMPLLLNNSEIETMSNGSYNVAAIAEPQNSKDGRLSATPLDISWLNEHFEALSPQDILAWTWETFGSQVATSSSFQTQSVPLLHLIAQTCPKMAIIFLDTGFHFPETLSFRDELQARYNLNIIVVYPAIDKSQLFRQHGEGLYRQDPDLCCYINKVEPMQRIQSTLDLKAWISGVRRDQTNHRQGLRLLEPQSSGLLKIHPMLNWTSKKLWSYIDYHQLPTHPLFSKGYYSIGCAPCTRPIVAGEDERAGRWADKDKIECGLHL